MGWGVVAIFLVGLVVIVRTAGFSHLAAKWLEQEGQVEGVRALRWAALLIWTGAMLSIVGGIWDIGALFVAGLVVMGSDLIPLAWYSQVAKGAHRS